MRDNSPSQHVQEACPSRCTLPCSQRPATLPSLPHPPFSACHPPTHTHTSPPSSRNSVSPLRGEAETGEEQCRGFAGALRFEERQAASRRARGGFRCVEKAGHLSATSGGGGGDGLGGGIGGLETIVIIKVSSFTLHASCSVSASPPFSSPSPLPAHLTYRSASQGGSLEAGGLLIGAEGGVCVTY